MVPSELCLPDGINKTVDDDSILPNAVNTFH